MQLPMFGIVRIFDEIDDMLGIVNAANSGAYVLIVVLSLVLLVLATLTEGLRGLLVSILVCGAAISAAGLSRPTD